jgi:hypothetical protein
MQNLKFITTDEITLYSDEDPAKVVLNQVDFELEQSHKMRGVYNKITISDGSYGSYCQQSIQNKHQKKIKYRVDLAYLDPIPVREHHTAWKWGFGAIGLSLLSGLMIWLGWFSNSLNPSIYHLTATVTVVTATLICLLLFAHKSYDKVVFHSQHGNVQLIELLNRYPDNESFKKFIGKLILRIKSAKKNKKLSPSKFLAGELKELRRLKDEDVISAEIYETAKVEIFHNESYQVTNPRNLQ